MWPGERTGRRGIYSSQLLWQVDPLPFLPLLQSVCDLQEVHIHAVKHASWAIGAASQMILAVWMPWPQRRPGQHSV